MTIIWLTLLNFEQCLQTTVRLNLAVGLRWEVVPGLVEWEGSRERLLHWCCTRLLSGEILQYFTTIITDMTPSLAGHYCSFKWEIFSTIFSKHYLLLFTRPTYHHGKCQNQTPGKVCSNQPHFLTWRIIIRAREGGRRSQSQSEPDDETEVRVGSEVGENVVEVLGVRGSSGRRNG